MTIEDIAQMARDFRKAIDDGLEWGVFGNEFPFSNFPHECCDDTSDLFGELLLQNGVYVTKVLGMYRYNNWDKQYSHVWLQLEDGTIIDLTGDQYKGNSIMLNYSECCYIGKPDLFHRRFPPDEIEPEKGFTDYIEILCSSIKKDKIGGISYGVLHELWPKTCRRRKILCKLRERSGRKQRLYTT